MTITIERAKVGADAIAVIFKNERGEPFNRYIKTKAEIEAQLVLIPEQAQTQKDKIDEDAKKALVVLQSDLDFLAS